MTRLHGFPRSAVSPVKMKSNWDLCALCRTEYHVRVKISFVHKSTSVQWHGWKAVKLTITRFRRYARPPHIRYEELPERYAEGG